MLPFGQSPSALVTTHFELAGGDWFPLHTHHQAHQLVWARRGVLSVRAKGATWVLPSGLALWLPVGLAHETGAAVAADMAGIYVDPHRCPIRWDTPTVVAVDALQRELLVHLERADLEPGPRRRAEATLFDVLQPAPAAVIDVPDLVDPRAVAVAAALAADPADPRSLEAWGRAVGASGRTLARVWSKDTGMAFAAWRTRLRIREAMPLLAAGRPIGAISRRVGYQTSSAFVAAFRREIGVTPGHYLPRG
jgi:AraC-like DNA-binding protein